MPVVRTCARKAEVGVIKRSDVGRRARIGSEGNGNRDPKRSVSLRERVVPAAVVLQKRKDLLIGGIHDGCVDDGVSTRG